MLFGSHDELFSVGLVLLFGGEPLQRKIGFDICPYKN